MELERPHKADWRFSLTIVEPDVDDSIARSVSALLTDSSADLMESRGGHVPDQVVTTIIHRAYTSLESVTQTFARFGHRFAVLGPSRELVATALVSCQPDVVLGLSGHEPIGPAMPGRHPQGYHSIFNLAVARQWRRKGIARTMLQQIATHHRHLFTGLGWWARSEPPDHDVYVRLGFVHQVDYDSFFDGTLTPSRQFRDVASFNRHYACDCKRRPLTSEAPGKLRCWAFTQSWP